MNLNFRAVCKLPGEVFLSGKCKFQFMHEMFLKLSPLCCKIILVITGYKPVIIIIFLIYPSVFKKHLIIKKEEYISVLKALFNWLSPDPNGKEIDSSCLVTETSYVSKSVAMGRGEESGSLMNCISWR